MNSSHLSTLFTVLTVVLLTLSSASAQTTRSTSTEKPKNPLVGHWVCEDDGTKVEIRADNTVTINETEYTYKIRGSIITVASDEGSMAIPFELVGDRLTVEVEGREMVYKRVKPGSKGFGSALGTSSGERVMQDLVGKWCYLSNLTGSNSRMSSRCFVLNSDGTYEYSAETSSSGAIGSSANQEYDSGRWTATRTSITAYSNKRGKMVYPIELRNHPKTGDPMIVLDGDAYVTAYQKRPW